MNIIFNFFFLVYEKSEDGVTKLFDDYDLVKGVSNAVFRIREICRLQTMAVPDESHIKKNTDLFRDFIAKEVFDKAKTSEYL